MKTLHSTVMMLAMMVAALSFTACGGDSDDDIDNGSVSGGESMESLKGTWAGSMNISLLYWNGKSYYSYETELTFINDPLTSQNGSGYWVDRYSDAPWNYVAYHIEWQVNKNVIHINFVEGNTSLEIRDYKLNYGDRFVGKIYDDQGSIQNFKLSKTKTPDYSNCFWGIQSGATPTPIPVDQVTRTFTANGVSFKMIRVDGGTFTMGATDEQRSDAGSDEIPPHQVTLSSYYIGETEVTQELWQAVMGQKPTSDGSHWSSTYGLGNNYPAYYVSWDDCQEFVRKLNSLTGQNFRLPTEAEWEFAARGGNQSRGYKYAGSNTIDNVAWFFANSDRQTHNVASKAANELGLYDMSGNIWEWCQDWYDRYSSSSQTNPTGPSGGNGRVIRGGSSIFGATSSFCRVSHRSNAYPAFRDFELGLRLAVSQTEDVNHDFQCFFLFDTQLHPMPCHLTSIISNPGQFCKIEAAQERGIRHLKTTRNYDGSTETILLSTERENQETCILGVNNCIIVGTSNYDNILIAYEGQCSNCLELYGGTHYPLLWEKNGMQLHCSNCGRIYDVNNGTVVSGDGCQLYRYQAAFDGQFIRVWN